jgi:hypothetical protein
MQVRVTLGTQEFTTLLDSGSTTNFISSAADNGAYVRVANSDRVGCRGLARDVTICIGQEELLINYFSIPLDYYDMVLIVSFLHTLGPILWDFYDLCMAVWHHNSWVLWKGLDSPHNDIPPTGRVHAMRHDEPALLACLLQFFEDVFAAPSGLPPAHPCDHRIHLKPNTMPVAVHCTAIHSSKRMSLKPSARPC